MIVLGVNEFTSVLTIFCNEISKNIPIFEAMSKKENLFEEFSPISLKEWEEKIEKDLKGKPLSILEYTHANSIELIPYFNQENSKNYSESANRTLKNSRTNEWNINALIEIENEKEANEKALKALSQGANSLFFIGELKNLEVLLSDIMIEIIAVNFITPNPSQLAIELKKLCLDRSITFIDQEGSITFDYLGNFAKKGRWLATQDEVLTELENIVNTTIESDLIALTASNYYFQQCGADIVQQVGIALAHGVEYINLLNKKFTSDEIANTLQFEFAIGENYLGEIAKLRAFRLLWNKVLAAFEVFDCSTIINGTTSPLFWSNKQPKNNMLRATSSAMSAIIGGCDSLTVLPFDLMDSKKESFAERVANNIQLILKEESYFDKVTDPAKGSYYIENLTEEIAERAWEFFQEIERKGGYIKALEANYIQGEIEKSADQLMEKYNAKEITLVGVNKYETEDRQVTLKRKNEPEMNEIRSLSFLHLA